MGSLHALVHFTSVDVNHFAITAQKTEHNRSVIQIELVSVAYKLSLMVTEKLTWSMRCWWGMLRFLKTQME